MIKQIPPKACFWKEELEQKLKYTIQISFPVDEDDIKKVFKNWKLCGQGFDKKSDLKILIFYNYYDTIKQWDNFKTEKNLPNIFNLKEIE